jgi:hypothetical protein
VVSVREAGALLDRMTNYSTVGFSVINNWAEGATSAGKEATWEKKLVEV